MSQQHQMQMSGIGGPVGGPVGQPANAGTPTANYTPDAIIKKLNTAIYDYLLCQQQYEVARVFSQKMEIETSDVKQSPNQRQNQANGIDGSMDVDSKEHVGIQKRPNDLPAPSALSSEDSPFLQDWWCQFWELYQGNRHRGKPTTLNYVGQQRNNMKTRVNAVNGMDPNAMRQQQQQYNTMNGMANNDLRKAAMGNNVNGMTQQQIQAMQKQRQLQQGNAQGGTQMERQGSQMNMSDPRSGSPNTGGGGEAPSPKRQRLEGNMQQQQQQQQAMNQARAAQPGQMQGANQSVEAYSAAMQAQMQTAIQRSSSNGNKGMPQNPAMGPGGAQSSPMAQQAMEGNAGGDFQYNQRMGIPGQNGATPAAGQQGQANNGNHALQDYQMQLMLLEQQNKKRLLMARQEQDSMAHPTGVPGPNGGRGSPQPGMMDPNNPQMRQGMMIVGQNGQPLQRAPSSHPMTGQQMTPQQMEIMRQQQQGMMQNGQMYPGGPPGQQGQMMAGQQPGQQGPPGQPPNMTPRPNNMPPPPAPGNQPQSGTQPSSPAQQAAPPTPNQANKPKPGAKKAADNKKGPAAKKGGADAQSENAPTPTPPPPVTPSNAQAFGNNKNLPMQNGAPGQGPPQSNGPQQNNVQGGVPDMNNAPFGALDGADQFSGMDFANLDSGDVLDNFDFDSFLNNTAEDNGLGFDANFAFGDGGIETDGLN
ncbi:hypothetical protein CKM354_000555800 [Cercospora kikuchii]|uniref:LisH domain-containing protein n=1 Tax=Cercospora kikuchii TaxID=84275 RepID=A0A9P3CPU6_9PEZI|nr:uncharacterized protein CKM354_000555800 [Cercospora kikuchii]GIZ42283.1 hypothetical protein CKM354_000555800 [Cercospora kikuchii]